MAAHSSLMAYTYNKYIYNFATIVLFIYFTDRHFTNDKHTPTYILVNNEGNEMTVNTNKAVLQSLHMQLHQVASRKSVCK